MISFIKCSTCGQNLSNSTYKNTSKKHGTIYYYNCNNCNKNYNYSSFLYNSGSNVKSIKK